MWVVRSGSLLVPVPEVERHSRQLQAGVGLWVVDEVHHGHGSLHHRIPLYSRPWGSLPRAFSRTCQASKRTAADRLALLAKVTL